MIDTTKTEQERERDTQTLQSTQTDTDDKNTSSSSSSFLTDLDVSLSSFLLTPEQKVKKEKENLVMLEDVLIANGGIEVTPLSMYQDIFKVGEGYLQSYKNESKDLKANPLVYMKKNSNKTGFYRVLFEDQMEEVLKEAYKYDFAITNGITYFGRKNTQNHASKMFAMIFDLDGVHERNLINFFSAIDYSEMASNEAYIYPRPNYIVLSGHGVHLYYLFDWPLPLYPNIKMQLKELKYALTRKLWNQYTSDIDKPQFQGINQGFRVAGSTTKIPGYKSKVFKFNNHPWTLERLCDYVDEKYRVDEKALFKETKLTLKEAQLQFPEWYERIVVKKDRPRTWTNKRDLYDWWLRRIKKEATFGHRYFCIMMLAIYAIKCGIDKEELDKDAYGLITEFNSLNPLEPFTESDVASALECYDLKYKKFPIKDIVKLTNIKIEKNKRNGRKQKIHLERARAVQEIDYPNGSWKGRKPQEATVLEWIKHNPNGSKYRCCKETGLSKPTVYKWWPKK